MRDSRFHWVVLALCLALASGCAAGRSGGVPVESRPTPPQPGEPTPRDVVVRPEKPSTTDERSTQISRVVADTTAARGKLEKCTGRRLLPDQEGVHDATVKALRDTRAALATGDLARAQSLARQARSLAASLTCR